MHPIWLVRREAGWQAFFEQCGMVPLPVVYEELVEAYEATALRILDYLGVAYPPDLIFGQRKMKKQATELNERWAARYRELKEGEKGKDPHLNPPPRGEEVAA